MGSDGILEILSVLDFKKKSQVRYNNQNAIKKYSKNWGAGRKIGKPILRVPSRFIRKTFQNLILISWEFFQKFFHFSFFCCLLKIEFIPLLAHGGGQKNFPKCLFKAFIPKRLKIGRSSRGLSGVTGGGY